MEAPEVASCVQDLRKAVVVMMMEPTSSPERRAEALRFCQEFRDTSPLCLPCGLVLAKNTEAPVVRHFGLWLLGHVIEVRWDALHPEERARLQQRALELISGAAMPDETYVKDAVARLMVEVIKKGCPASWQTMLSKLKILSWRGASQAQLVLLTLLRLAEDVKTSEKLPSTPSDVLKNSLLLIMASLSSMLVDLLRGYWYEYKHLATGESQIQACCCVVAAALNALTGYMGWTSMDHFTQNNYQLLKMLWHFLEDPKLQLEASECLLIAIQRIGSGKDNPSLLVQFEDVPLRYLAPITMADGEELTERHYFFMRAQCRLVCVLIEQFCSTMDLNGNIKIPSNLGQYLNILLDFTTHSSLFLSFITQSTWRHLFEQACLSHTPLVEAMLPKYLTATRMNLVKVGFPSKDNSPRCEYSRLEFGGDMFFSEFLATFHDEQRRVIGAAFRLDQRTCYQIAFEYLKYLLAASVDPGPMNCVTADKLCHASSQPFLQWEAATFFVKVIIENMFKIRNKENMPVDDCLELLQLVMTFKTEDPLILACVQTNISTLSPFLNSRTERSSQVLSKFLDMIGEIKAPKARSLKSVRRSKCSRFIQMCRKNAHHLLLDVWMLIKQVSQLLYSNTPMQMEKGTVLKAMVIIINQFKNFELQKGLLEELMAPITSVWQSKDMQLAISEPSAFIEYVGANICLTDTVMESPMAQNRSRIMDCVSSILAVSQWSRWPSDLEEAKTGGFVIGGKPIYRNPCTELVQKLLDNIFVLIKTQHELYIPQETSKLSYSFAKALGPLKMENASTLDLPQPLLDIFDPPEYKTALERMQAFFCTLHEACFSVLGHAVSTVNEGLYTMTDSASRLFESIFEMQKWIPHHRLRTMVRAYLKPLVLSCPSEYYERFLCPTVKRSLDIFHGRLSDEWNIINQRNMSSKESTATECPAFEITMLEKTLEIQAKLLTDEFMEFLFACFVPNKDVSVTAVSKGACFKDTDTSVVSATSDDFCCVSEDEDVCTPECDDDICVSNKEAEPGVVAAVSDGDCCAPIENNDPCPVLDVDLEEGEMAAEVPLLWSLPASLKFLEPLELTTLGVCLLKEKDLLSSLLLTAFSSLVWNDSETCTKIATSLCWALLKQAILEPLSAEHTRRLLIMVLRGIQKYKNDPFSRDVLVNLAFHVCKSLRPLDKQFSQVSCMDLGTEHFYFEKFDLKRFCEEIQCGGDTTKHYLKCLIEECTKKPLGKMFPDEGVSTPPPPFLKQINAPITDKQPDDCPPPAKKLLT